MNNEKHNIDKLLKDHNTIPTPSTDLNARIIAAAQSMPQKKPFDFFALLRAPFTTKPKWSYGFASLLLAGIIIAGISYQPQQDLRASTTDVSYTMDDLFADDMANNNDGLLIL